MGTTGKEKALEAEQEQAARSKGSLVRYEQFPNKQWKDGLKVLTTAENSVFDKMKGKLGHSKIKNNDEEFMATVTTLQGVGPLA